MWLVPSFKLLLSAPLFLLSLIGPALKLVSAQAGAELFFDGIDDSATAFPTFDLLSQWTIEGWIRPAKPVKTGACILGIQTTSGRNLLTLTTTEHNAWRVVYGGEQDIPSKAWVSIGYQPESFASSPHHFAITHSVLSIHQSILELFINGTQHATWFGSNDALRARPEIALPALLGACNQAGVALGEGAGRGVFRTNFYHGHMDEIRLWSTVRTQQEILLSQQWTGPASSWPTPAGSSLTSQYSCDVTTSELHDSTTYNNHGWLGTVGDVMNSPTYVPSAFSDDLLYGPTYLQLRERVPYKVELLTYIFHETISYNAVLIVQAPLHNEALLRLPGDTTSQPLQTDQLVSSLSFDILANVSISNGTFAVRPCRGFPLQTPLPQYCTDPILYYSFSTAGSVEPFAGPSYAVQLLRSGGYIKLPKFHVNTTLEFWAQLTPPLMKDATLLSISETRASRNVQEREIVRWWLDPFTGVAVLNVCTMDGYASIAVPGVATVGPQHLSISFEEIANASVTSWNYSVSVYRNCILVAQANIHEPCARLDSSQLRQPTIGQSSVPDELGSVGTLEPSSTSFLPMYIAEIRLWSVARNESDLCSQMSQRLHGNETNLISYVPVASEDYERQQLQTIGSPLLLSNDALPKSVSEVLTASATSLVCATSFVPCPDVASGTGFVIRQSPFGIPPEIVSFDTFRSIVSIELAAHDNDNYKDHMLDSIAADTLRYEIVEIPDPKCGYIYAKGETFRILSTAERLQFGLTPATTILESSKLPLRFVPFEGATVAEEEAMGGACSAELKYKVLDSQGLASQLDATIRINVWHEGITLIGVNASDPGVGDSGLDSGDIIRFDFNVPTNEPLLEARDLFDVDGGSWGASTPTLTWINNGMTLLMQMTSASEVGTAILTPNITRFRGRRAANLHRKGDPLSQPFSGVSPLLTGNFGEATCLAGTILNWATGACDACPVGSYWKVQESTIGLLRRGVQCAPCPGGSFGNTTAALTCFPCNPGRYMPPLDGPNSALSNRSECLQAPRGSFVTFSNASAVEPCQAGTVSEQEGQMECNVCPSHADCESGSTPRSQAVALPGYFRISNGSFASCRIPKSCLGAGVCKEGAQDSHLGCYPCANGWTRFAGSLRDARECVKCPSLFHGLFIACAVGLGTALFVIFLTRINITAARHKACLHPFMLKICLSHFQLMSAFGRFEEWELEDGFGDMASFLRLLFSWCFAWDGAMPSYLIPSDCILREFNMSRNFRLWFQLAFWATLPFTFMISCLLVGALVQKLCEFQSCILDCICCGPCTQNEVPDDMSSSTSSGFHLVHPALAQVDEHPAKITPDGDPYEIRAFGIWRKLNFQTSCKTQLVNFFHDSSGLMIASLVLTYPSVLQQVMAYIRCDSLDGNTKNAHLLFEPGLICGKGEHAGLLIVAWLVLLVWGLGFPAFCGNLLYRNRRKLNEFSTHCRLGLLGAEYEPRYFFWDAFILLRRFAASVAMLIAPSASRPLQLAVLLALGLVSLFVHVLYTPFDNRSGELLDVMETQALKIFCATCAVMLVGFSNVTHPGVCFTLAFIALLVHVLYILRVLVNFMMQVYRSVAEGLVDDEMLGRAPTPGQLIGPMRALQERIFLIDAETRMSRAHVYYRQLTSEIELALGPRGGEATDYERMFLAQGLAECLASIVTEHKLERVSVHFVEFMTRLAFSDKWERLCCMDHQYRMLSAKLKPAENSKSPPPDGKWKKSTAASSSANMFNPDAFSHGLSASDFQLELISISVCKRAQLDKCFKLFMQSKGVGGSFQLDPRERLLGSVWKNKQDMRKSKSMLALPAPLSENGTPGHMVLQVTDVDAPVTLPGEIENPALLSFMVTSAAGFTPSLENMTDAVYDLTQMFEVKKEVVDFTKRGIEGVWCTYFRERTNEWLRALYSLDEGAKYFILLTGEQLDTQELVCPVASVIGICSLEKDDAADFPKAVMDILRQEDSDRLVMVTFNRAGKLTRFCLTEESASWRTNFVQSMNVLASYRRTIRDEEMAAEEGR